MPAGTVLLSERDFLTAMRESQFKPASGVQVSITRRLLILANTDEALGVSARYSDSEKFSGNFFIVARNPRLVSGGQVEVSDYYFAAVELSGTSTWQGTLPKLELHTAVPEIRHGFCGLVSMPSDAPRCDRPPCGLLMIPIDGGPPASRPSSGLETGFAIEDGEPLFGSDRWPAASRVTLRLPDPRSQTRSPFDMISLACSPYRPPPQRIGRCQSGEVEICNGIDDNCNGEIDEGSACANRGTACACTPRTCAELGATRGQMHDGCDNLLNCGPPCP